MKKFVRSRVIREREINMISTNKAIAGVVLVTLLNGFISVNLFKKQNLFYTNEKSSVNREMNYSKSVLLKSFLLKKIVPLRGEKLWEDYLNFKSLRLPILNKEFTANNIIDFTLLLCFLYSLKNKKLLNIK